MAGEGWKSVHASVGNPTRRISESDTRTVADGNAIEGVETRHANPPTKTFDSSQEARRGCRGSTARMTGSFSQALDSLRRM